MERDGDVFVDGLALVVVFWMGLAIGASQGLGGFVGFEAEVAFLVLVGAGFVAETGVAEHQVVIGLEVFGIDGERLLEFFGGVGVALLEEEDAAEFIKNGARTVAQSGAALLLLQGFPEHIRQKAHQDVSLYPILALVPDGPGRELTLMDTEGGLRLGQLLLLIQGKAEVMVRLGIIGLYLDSLAIGGLRFGQLLLVSQGDAEVVVRPGQIGL